MKRIASKSSRLVLTVSALCLLVLAMIWVSYFRQKGFDRKDAIQFAVEKNSNLLVAFEHSAISTIQNADAVLQLVRMEYGREGRLLDLEKILANRIFDQAITQGLSIIDKNGKLVISNLDFPKQPTPHFSDRDYFAFHSKSSHDSLLISQPLISRATNQQVIIISRQLKDPTGQFAGVVALQIEPSRFTSFYAQAKLLPNDIISLIAPNGITYARRTGSRESAGEDIRKSPLFTHVARNSDSFYFAPGAITGIPTLFRYRQLKNYPIIATVGSSEADIFALYADRQSMIFTTRAIVSVLLILFSITIALALLHKRKTTTHLAEAKERYENLLTQQMIAVQEREREWIGRELHDNVNQVLTTVKLYLETASRQGNDPLIPRSMQLINNSINDIRSLSHQLSAPTLGTRSLIDSINALIEMVSSPTKLCFAFDHRDYQIRLIMSQKLALYRILQEQVNNIVKHAAATNVWITLSQKDNNVVLMVKDDGKGFNCLAKTAGMGLNNITSRIKAFGGYVQIESAPGKGCRLMVTAPIIRSEN